MNEDRTAPVPPDLSVEVDDVDAVYAALRERGAQILYPLTDEEWGCGGSSCGTPAAVS